MYIEACAEIVSTKSRGYRGTRVDLKRKLSINKLGITPNICRRSVDKIIQILINGTM